VRVAQRFEMKLLATSKVWESIECLAAIDDYGNDLVNLEIGAEAAVNARLNLRVVFQNQFNSRPAPGKDDKKLLTFSDNVQDAAHRAGFFNGRTYRFNFRTALQKVILDAGNGKSLSQLSDIFRKYWLDKVGLNRYVATFLAPNMEWLNEYDELKKNGSLQENSKLIDQVHNRVGWEIVSEYGFRTRIGRTLEKTSSSVVYLDHEHLESALEKMLEPIQNEIGGLSALDKDRLETFLLGLIIHLKNQGGIYQPHLNTFIETFGSSFVLGRPEWMPNFGQASRTPAFLTHKKREPV